MCNNNYLRNAYIQENAIGIGKTDVRELFGNIQYKVVHKKYTYKKGKKFGPYYYETKRVDGRVVTTYLGKNYSNKEKRDKIDGQFRRFFSKRTLPGVNLLNIPNGKKLFLGIGLFVLLAGLLLFFAFLPSFSVTGRAGLDMKANYEPGELITGTLTFSLKEGELIPLNSKINVYLDDEEKEFELSEFVDVDKLDVGNYYAEGTTISGEGAGFGLIGSAEIVPEIEFDLEIFEGEMDFMAERREERDEANDAEIAEVDNEFSEEEIVDGGEDIDESAIGNESLGEVEESVESDVENEEIEESVEGDGENEENVGEIDLSDDEEEVSDDEESSGAGITGAVVAENSDEKVISGAVSKGKDFEYELDEGLLARIVKGSIKVEGKEIDDDEIEIQIENGKAVISTDYVIVKGGYGEDFLGNKKLDLVIDIGEFGLIANNDSELSVVMEFENEVIVSVGAKVNVGDKLSGEENVSLNEDVVILGAHYSANISVNTTQFGAVMGKPVRWVKKIDVKVYNKTDMIVEIPVSAENIVVRKKVRNVTKIVQDFEEDTVEDEIEDIEEVSEEENVEIVGEEEEDEVVAEILNETDNEQILDEELVSEGDEFENNESHGSISEEEINQENEEIEDAEESVDTNEEIVGEGLEESSESDGILEDSDGSEVVSEDEEEIVINVGITGEVTYTTGRVSAELELKKESRFERWIKGVFGITGYAVINETASDVFLGDSNESVQELIVEVNESEESVEIEYYTDAPYAVEEVLDRGKKVNVIGPEDVHYENVLSYSFLDESWGLVNPEKIKIRWESEGGVGIEPYVVLDTDGNGIYDYLEWVAPRLSNQTFIIVIVSAEHLNESREFVSDIYDSVKELDNIWSEPIPTGDWVRVTFEENLTSEKDITIFPRFINGTINGEPQIDVFEIGKNVTIATFSNISEYQYNKVYLTSLGNVTQDTFDLLMHNVSFEFDHIIDPTVIINVNATFSNTHNVTIQNNFSHLSVSNNYPYNNLVMYYSFDTNTSATKVYDYTEHGNDGTFNGNARYNNSGKYGGNFYQVREPDNTAVSFPSISNINVANMSVSVWANPKGLPHGSADRYAIIHGAISASSNEVLRLEFTQTDNMRSDNDFSVLMNCAGSANGNWRHYVYTINDTAAYIYRDGVFCNSDTSFTATSGVLGAQTFIGGRDTTSQLYNGSIDEVMLFNVTLTIDEVKEIFNNQSARFFDRGDQTFDNINLSDEGTENRVNVTIYEQLHHGNVNFTVRIGNLSGSVYSYGPETQITNGVANDIVVGEPNNVSVKVVFYADSNSSNHKNFYTPIIRHNITFESWALGDANTAPTNPVVRINSTTGANRTAENLHCNATIIDPEADAMSVQVRWYNDTVTHIIHDYNNSYASGTEFSAVMNHTNTTKGDNWNCSLRLYDGSLYSETINSSTLTILNTPPNTPALSSPDDADSTGDRTPTFTWDAPIDDDGDALVYDLNLTCYSTSGGDCNVAGIGKDNRTVKAISGTSHEIVGDLQYLYDNNYYYNWSVRANDTDSFGNWSIPRRLNITAIIALSLPNSTIAFGTLTFPAGSDDTSDDSPFPFRLQNDGTVIVNVTAQATNLWNASSNPTANFRYKIDNNSLENYSFNWKTSVVIYTNMPASGSPLTAIAELNYTNSTDTCEIDINITVPADEPAGFKSSFTTLTGSLAES